MKECNKCKVEKPLEMFHKNRTRPDGLRYQCKECSKKYHKTPSGKAAREKYKKTDKFKATKAKSAAKYRRSDKGKASIAKSQAEYQPMYRKSDKGKAANAKGCAKYRKTNKGKESIAKTQAKLNANNPYRRRAHNIVNNAISRGELIRPNKCSECLINCKPNGHHDDYNLPLNVRWLCKPCHREWHIENKPIEHIDKVIL